MDCISVKDVGRCVVNVLLRPKPHFCRVLPLTAEKLTVQQITDTFNKHFTDRKFICPRVRQRTPLVHLRWKVAQRNQPSLHHAM